MDDEQVELAGGGVDTIAQEFSTYEDYLDRQVTNTDLFYLEDVELARQLVELGYRGNGEILRRDEFEARKEAAEQSRQQKLRNKPKKLASADKDCEGKPLLQALQQREEAVRSGKLTTIIFIRDRNTKGQEVSGYIDFAHRLKTENLEPVFEGRRRLVPKPTDLSFYNWETQTSTSNPTPSFQVIADNIAGLLFKNKRDRKIINVDPAARAGDNSTRTELETDEYTQGTLDAESAPALRHLPSLTPRLKNTHTPRTALHGTVRSRSVRSRDPATQLGSGPSNGRSKSPHHSPGQGQQGVPKGATHTGGAQAQCAMRAESSRRRQYAASRAALVLELATEGNKRGWLAELP